MKKQYRVTIRMAGDLYQDLIRYAVGGDITLSEAIRGLIGKPNTAADQTIPDIYR